MQNRGSAICLKKFALNERANRSLNRRELLHAGLAAFGSMSLSELFRLRASQPDNGSERTAVIIVWLRGGCSHLDTFDPKPNAPSEYRGPFKTIRTTNPALRVTELLPRLAQQAHRYTVLRSLTHTGGGHPAGSLQMLAGDADAQDKLKPILPDWMSIANYLRADRTRSLPNYVGVNPITRYDNFTIAGASYLGEKYAPFAVLGDPDAPNFQVPNIGVSSTADKERLEARRGLQQQLDGLRRDIDSSGSMEAMDRFEAQALNLLTSSAASRAFNLNLEDPRTRDRYGRNQWGQQLLMARRLVEAGVEIITSTFDGSLCGRVGNWDDHAVNHHVFEALQYRAPFFDQAVSALIEDLYERGLDKRVLVVVTGEFGRTPKISYVASSGGGVASGSAGTVQPGRDHWPNANSMIWAGGGIRPGQIIGSTDRRGEEVVERRSTPQDFLATIYHHLGIDFEKVTIPDFTGRPTPIITHGSPIRELVK